MEKAILEMRKSNSGKLIGSIKFENGKSMPIPSKFQFTEEMDNKECEVERVKGQPVKIIIDSKELSMNKRIEHSNSKKHNYANNYKSNNKPRNAYQATRNNNVSIPDAFAPYNFIPLNEKVIPIDKPADFDRYIENTGYIDLEIETKTPIYIRGKGSDFYKQADKYRIPGSSLRGMIRTIVEIVSWSKFGFVNDDYLYYRAFADKAHSIRDEYNNNMKPEDEDGNGQYLMKSGLLFKRGLNYFIIPEDKAFENIKKPVSKERIEKKRMRYNTSSFYKIDKNYYIVVPGKKFKEEWSKRNDWQVFTNPENKDSAFMIPEKDIISFRNDTNRKAPDILKKADNTEVPCFYVNWTDSNGEERISFGHTPLFRLSYFKSIGEHIKQQSPDDNKFDFAESMFGMETNFATRLFFEDLILKTTNDSREEKISKILASPNPTSFQIYLDQIDSKYLEDLKHYNTDSVISGNKVYWHQKNHEWAEKKITLNKYAFENYLKKNSFDFEIFRDCITRDDRGKIELNIQKLDTNIYLIIVEMIKKEIKAEEKKEKRKIDTQHSVITPINEVNIFSGKIRFENLTNIELGALLFALDLPQGCFHKIGMGKPLGLGSIQTKPTLYLSDRKERYKNLFNNIADFNPESQGTINNLKNDFEEFILQKVKKTDEKSLWDIDRLKELKQILTFDHNIDKSKISYMEGPKPFARREILPRPTKVR